MDENKPYPVLLGIDWAKDMKGVINLKMQMMAFEKKLLCVVVPLDLAEGPCYTKLARDYESDDDLDQIYKITKVTTHRIHMRSWNTSRIDYTKFLHCTIT